MVLPIKFQAQVLQLLYDGHNWNTMFQDVTQYVKECP